MKFNFKFLCCSFVIPISLLLTSCARNNLKENLDPNANEEKLIVEPRFFDVFKFKKLETKAFLFM